MDGGDRIQTPVGLSRFHLVQAVTAGEITEVHPRGCYVRHHDGRPVLRPYLSASTPARPRLPKKGDFWLVLGDGSEAVLERGLFVQLFVTHAAPAGLQL